jgi:hypothetical protein
MAWFISIPGSQFTPKLDPSLSLKRIQPSMNMASIEGVSGSVFSTADPLVTFSNRASVDFVTEDLLNFEGLLLLNDSSWGL